MSVFTEGIELPAEDEGPQPWTPTEEDISFLDRGDQPAQSSDPFTPPWDQNSIPPQFANDISVAGGHEVAELRFQYRYTSEGGATGGTSQVASVVIPLQVAALLADWVFNHIESLGNTSQDEVAGIIQDLIAQGKFDLGGEPKQESALPPVAAPVVGE
jgi:hypothetical protein